ncbi:MAG: undecaprenyldiphospho-muramoylpentapeptide beta-N-acetylglucosaminyltransferase [Anaerolineae bacterium]|nr:MAG: undecaprenyldiphospho-muramoylpentapeptide beta-N-acetylglucosaminyltransferase [Anaerolineae bacterium]
MRLLICAGGTGGGVYPALAVLHQLTNECPDLQTLWVGGQGGMEEDLVQRAGVPFESVPAAGVHGVGLRQLPGNLGRLARGVLASRRILERFRPDALFFTGGYVAIPMALAARLVSPRPRVVLYVPDIEPGLALKVLARFADHIALTTEDSRAFFQGVRAHLSVTGYPIRPELRSWEREAARKHFGLHTDIPVLLVFGGSQGARSINQALGRHLPALLAELQVLHICGKRNLEEARQAAQTLSPELAQRYHLFDYLHGEEMGAALAAADLVLSRAGASCIGEFPYFGLPAILVPYPYAWRYQQVNAEYLERHQAAIVLPDADLQSRLADTVLTLARAPERLTAMRAAMSGLSTPQAAQNIGHLLISPPSGQGAKHHD